MLPPLHVRPPAPRALTDFAPPPPAAARARPAAKTLPYRHTFPTGPGLRAGEARPRRPAPHAPQAGGKPPYFGRFCPFAAPPSGRAHSQKSIAKKWKIFMECSLQFLSIFTNLFYNESSTQPRSGRARAPGGGAGRTLSGQIVPLFTGPVSHPRFSVCRERAPSPARPAPGGRIVCFVCTSLARGAAAPTGPARRAASYGKGGMPMIVRKEKCSCKS